MTRARLTGGGGHQPAASMSPCNEGKHTTMRLVHKAAGALLAGALVLTACGGNGDPLDTETGGNEERPAASDTIRVGSANFPENALLAEIYAGALEAEGVKVEKRLNIGSREAYLKGLQDGSIDLIPEYTGNLLLHYDDQSTAVESEEVYAQLPKALPDGLTVLDQAAAEDKDAVVVTSDTAEQYDLKTIADLKPHAPEFVLGGPPEWKTRSSGLPGLERVYDLDFKSFRALDVAGPLTVQALQNGQVQAANLFTTQSAIEANDFVVLEDPKHLFVAQNVVPLINEDKATEPVRRALNAVSAELDTPTLARLVKQVEVDNQNSADVAQEWLASHDLG